MSWFKREARKDDEFKRILVVVTRQIGDVLLTTPLIREAKRRWPQARIDVLGFAGTLGMLRGNPDVHALHEVKAGSSWAQSLPLILRLWRRYDLGLIAQHSDRAHLYGWMAARVRSGQVPENRRSWWKRALLVHSVELGTKHSHVVIEKLRLLAPWVGELTQVHVDPPGRQPVPDPIRQALQPRYVAMQVPSLVNFKQWPVGHCATLADELGRRGHQVVLTGGPSAADRTLVDQVLALSQDRGRLVDAAGKLSLNEMAELLAGAALFIGPDTSITHLASASRIPVIALFGPTNPTLWGPWPDGWPLEQPYVKSGLRQARGQVVLLQGPQTCVPCSKEGCDRHRDSRAECLGTMSVQRVLDEALAVLEPTSA